MPLDPRYTQVGFNLISVQVCSLSDYCILPSNYTDSRTSQLMMSHPQEYVTIHHTTYLLGNFLEQWYSIYRKSSEHLPFLGHKMLTSFLEKDPTDATKSPRRSNKLRLRWGKMHVKLEGAMRTSILFYWLFKRPKPYHLIRAFK